MLLVLSWNMDNYKIINMKDKQEKELNLNFMMKGHSDDTYILNEQFIS